ncbi:MAG: acyltransferase family protein [Pseudomonadota bacterium]
MDLAKRGFRADIQALRGLAVTIVVLYHSGLGIFSGGYLGVDVFFVVSGFLITSIIYRAISDRGFGFAGFYARRVRRLLPAAYVTLTATALGSYFLLTATQFHDFTAQLVGSIFFATNYVLWSQTGYFSPDAAFRPLLHMWSLAIEEQYYLIVPFLFVLLPRRWILPAVAAVTVVSLIACFAAVQRYPSVAFFWLPTRAWELGVGSLAALIANKPTIRLLAVRLLLPALALLVLIPLFPLPTADPGINAVLITLAAAVVILADSRALDAQWSVRGLARIGDVSYSLYLVHWPLFALARVTYLSHDLPVWLAIGLIGAALALAFALYRFVEEPVRRSALGGWRLAGVVLVASAAVLAFGLALGAMRPAGGAARAMLAPVAGLDQPVCFADVARFDGKCAQSSAPEILVWGDSLSAHLTPGIVASTQRPIAQASRGFCGPFADYAVVNTPTARASVQRCLAFNRSVLEYLRATPSIRVVVLTGFYRRSLDPGVTAVGQRGERPATLKETVAAQRETIAAIHALGRRAVTVSPPPVVDYDLGQCWERQVQRLPTLGVNRGCRIERTRVADDQALLDEMMAGFAAAGAPVIALGDGLCRNGQCATIYRGKPLFRDGDHLSRFGAETVGRRMRLGERLWNQAR